MSKAMDYLLQTRGEAMGSYFDFLRQAGSSLDPKTRSLISLLGKVHAQTEPGLRQYLPRALRDGASAAEILDTLLFSLPLLGLTRINWAIEIILDMDIPDFATHLLGDDPEWLPVAPLVDLPLDQSVRLQVGGRGVFVLREAEKITVYDSRCPHQLTDIPASGAAAKVLTCPGHGWQFDLQSGDCIANGKQPLRRLTHRITEAQQLEILF